MLGIQTIFAILLVFLAWLVNFEPSQVSLFFLALMGSLLIFFGSILVHAFAFISLQNSTRQIPSLIKIFAKNRKLFLVQIFLFLFVLFSFAISLETGMSARFLPSIWIVLFGAALDGIYFLLSCHLRYLDPYHFVILLADKAEKEMSKEDLSEFCHSIDAMTEIVIKAIQDMSLSLGEAALKKMEIVASKYIKNYSAKNEPSAGQKEQIYFILSYMLQRFELIHRKATEHQMESFSSHLIVIMGKLTVFLARFDSALAGLPLHYLGRFVRAAEASGLVEVAVKSTLILQEVASNILEEPQIMQLGIKDLFITLIGRLEEIAKNTFRKDKTTDLTLIMQPFKELKSTLTSEKYSSHPDSAIIVKDLDRVLGEFEALEMVLQTVPNIPGYEKKKETT